MAARSSEMVMGGDSITRALAMASQPIFFKVWLMRSNRDSMVSSLSEHLCSR